MLKLDGLAFYKATVALGMSRARLGDYLARVPDARSKKTQTGKVREMLELLSAELKNLGLSQADKAVQRLLEETAAGQNIHDADSLETDLRHLELRIMDGLDETYLLALSASESALYEPPVPIMGSEFPSRFGAANNELNEAAKCLALGCDTASAFHSLRCLEAGMLALSRCLSIDDPAKGAERNWGSYLRRIKAEMDKRWPAAQRLHGDGEVFENVYAALAAMQNPWRNATMHLDQNYQRDDATHLFEVVKGFMKRLNGRMDENGLPKA
ncbi:MAG TPA: hypothetical protein VN175_00980 [Rhizomicrobium sp.]|jgi:hypothetical protein|nr:hypothetical protein [Rhizomicrobium sp.]